MTARKYKRVRYSQQLHRAMLVLDAVRWKYRSVRSAAQIVNKSMEVCERTVRRDLEALVEAGYVKKIKVEGRPNWYRARVEIKELNDD